jgi:cytoskeletal protein RodZ
MLGEGAPEEGVNMDIGAQLRTARERKGLSIESLAGRTRIPARTVKAIELNDLSALPPHPFDRGFVRAYATEVGLDGERTAREYFAQFPPAPEPAVEPKPASHTDLEATFDLSSRWAGLAAAAVILVLVIVTAVIGGRGAPEGVPEAIGTAGGAQTTPAKDDGKNQGSQPVGSEATPQTTTSAPAATTPPASEPTASGLKFEFAVNRACWVTARADGHTVLYKIIQPGEPQTLTAARELALRFGDSGAVVWTLNGRKGESLGAAGAVRDLRITPENAGSVR